MGAIYLYGIDDCVMHAGSGACRVADICRLDVRGEENTEYYKLIPLYEKGSIIYTPVDRASGVMRRVHSDREILALLAEIQDVAALEPMDDRAREEQYKTLLKENTCRAWLTVIRSAYAHNARRAETSLKPTQMDERYMAIAENLLHGEVAASLSIDRESVREFIAEFVDGKQAAGAK